LYKIIGVGEAVKDVIAAFDKYPEYKTYYFNESDLGDYSSMQEYEENFPVSRVRKNLKTVKLCLWCRGVLQSLVRP